MKRPSRSARTLLLGAALALSPGCATAPYGPYQGPNPAPAAITAFDPRWESGVATEAQAGAPPFLIPGTTRRDRFAVGTVAIPPEADSLVFLVYGDNRPGLRMLTTAWGLPAVKEIASPDPGRILWGIVNIPVMLVQAFVPRLDLFQDLHSATFSHRYSGGNERGVLEAIAAERSARLVINTGDLIEDGRRGRHWEDFVVRHRPLRGRVPFLAAPGNHERLWDPQGRANWEAVLGPPASPDRYWYAADLPESIARFVFLDSEILCDPHDAYPDSMQSRIAEEQLRWVDSALAVPARWRFVVLHHPLVTSGHYVSDWTSDDASPPGTGRRSRLLEICRRRGVTAVFAGHEHLYQRTYVRGPDGRGFWHITTGGGGSPLYRLSGAEREAARRIRLPDGSDVLWNPEQSVYHYCRLTVPRRPGSGKDAVVLEVNRVRSSGEVIRLESVNLTRDPPEEPRERPGKRTS